MCQSHVSGNDSEKRDGRRGRAGRQRPDFTQKAWDQWIGRLCALCSQTSAHIHTLQPAHNAAVWWQGWPIWGPSEKLETDTQTDALRQTETHTNGTLPPLYLAGYIHCAPLQSPSLSLSSWRMDLGNCQLKWNPICGVEWGGHIQWNTHTHTSTQA